MGAQHTNPIQIGDWVRTKSSKGERIHGFVEKSEQDSNRVQLKVIASDNKLLSGHSIQVSQSKITIEDTFRDFAVIELEQLIDLALLTNDKAWFDELTTQFLQLQHELPNTNLVDYTAAPY